MASREKGYRKRALWIVCYAIICAIDFLLTKAKMPAILSPKISARRLAGSLVWSLAMAVSPLARDAEVRTLCRRIVGPHEGCQGWVIGTVWTRSRLRAALGTWRWPTLPGTHRALALALAERRVRPRLTAVA